MMYPL